MSADDFTNGIEIEAAPSSTIDYGEYIHSNDIIAFMNHKIGKTPFSSPYQHFAADVNNDNTLDVLDLLAENPFEDQIHGPKYIRVDRYRYKFAKRVNHAGGRQRHGQTTANNGSDGDNQNDGEPYWERELIGREFPRRGMGVATKEMLKDYMYDMM